MNQSLDVTSYILRRYLAFSIDAIVFSMIFIPIFMCYLLVPTLNSISHKDYWAATINYFTLGEYGLIIKITNFIIQLFVERVNSAPLFWSKFTQLIMQIIKDELTLLLANLTFPTVFIFSRAWSESSTKQASVGKRIMGLKVASQSTGGQIPFVNSLIRNTVAFFFGSISILFAFFTKRRQSFSDILVGAVVIESIKEESLKPIGE